MLYCANYQNYVNTLLIFKCCTFMQQSTNYRSYAYLDISQICCSCVRFAQLFHDLSILQSNAFRKKIFNKNMFFFFTQKRNGYLNITKYHRNNREYGCYIWGNILVYKFPMHENSDDVRISPHVVKTHTRRQEVEMDASCNLFP